MISVEKVVEAHKARLDSIHKMTETSLVALEQIGQLSVEASKSSLQDHSAHTQTLIGTKDLKELAKLNSKLLHDVAEQFVSYNHNLIGLVGSLGADLSQIVESQIEDAQAQFMSAVEVAIKTLPAGSDSVADIMKKAVSNANQALDTVKTTVKKTAEAQHASATTVSGNVVKIVKSAKEKAAKSV